MGHPQLPDSPQSLEITVLNQVKNDAIGKFDKPVDRIVNNLMFVSISKLTHAECLLLLN